MGVVFYSLNLKCELIFDWTSEAINIDDHAGQVIFLQLVCI